MHIRLRHFYLAMKMKTHSIFFSTLVLIFGVVLTSSASVASLSVSSVRGFTDRNSELALILSRATNATALQFDLSFDPSHADRLPPVWSQLLSNHVVKTHQLKSGLWRTLIYSPSNALIRPNVSLASLPFHIPAEERNGSGAIAPSGFVLSYPDATAFNPVTTRPGHIFVTQVSPPDPDGSVSIFFPVTQQGDYVLYASDDFKAWTSIATNAASGNIVDFIDADAVRYPHRFYYMDESRSAATAMAGLPIQFSGNGNDGILRIATPSSGAYVLEASSDLSTWTVIEDVAVTSTTAEVKISNPKLPDQRFFRLRPKR